MLIRLDSMIIAQVCLRLDTIKGHSKMCSFTVLGGVLKPVSIWCDHHLPHAVQTHLLHLELIRLLIVAWVMLVHSSSMLCEVAGYWQELEHTVVYADPGIPNMLNGWRVGEYAGHARTGMFFSFQELCTDPCNMGPCIIMLQHEVRVVDEWHTMGLRISSRYLCAFKMHLCPLSITYAFPYHNPTATMGHSIHNADTGKPLPHTTPYTLSAICLYSENWDLSVKRTPLQSARRHLKWAFAHSSRLRWRLQSVKTRWGWRACRWASWDFHIKVLILSPTVVASAFSMKNHSWNLGVLMPEYRLYFKQRNKAETFLQKDLPNVFCVLLK